MKPEQSPDAVERQFFAGLLDADVKVLDHVLADDFILIDVMSGSEVPKPVLLSVIGSGQLKFAAMDLLESRVHLYGDAAVIRGRTQMNGTFASEPFSASSRYTHVYVKQ